MATIMVAWSKRQRSKVYHNAAGQGPRTACGIRIQLAPYWAVGQDAPDGRTLCSRCVRAQADAGRGG